MTLLSHNLVAFYPIWVGFLLKIIALIGEHNAIQISMSKTKFLILAPSLNVVYDITLVITSM